MNKTEEFTTRVETQFQEKQSFHAHYTLNFAATDDFEKTQFFFEKENIFFKKTQILNVLINLSRTIFNTLVLNFHSPQKFQKLDEKNLIWNHHFPHPFCRTLVHYQLVSKRKRNCFF